MRVTIKPKGVIGYCPIREDASKDYICNKAECELWFWGNSDWEEGCVIHSIGDALRSVAYSLSSIENMGANKE